MDIKKGDKFKCIKDVIMNENSKDIAYVKGKIYTSEEDECITDDRGNIHHRWHGDEINKYFIKDSIAEDLYITAHMIPKYKEMVNHPSHYKNGKYEAIDIMLDVFGKDKVADFCELNAFKYLWRADNKGTDIQDKKKAIWYLNKYIELKEKV